MKFEWNAEKSEKNIREHGVSFQEALTVFKDVLSLTYQTLIIRLMKNDISS